MPGGGGQGVRSTFLYEKADYHTLRGVVSIQRLSSTIANVFIQFCVYSIVDGSSTRYIFDLNELFSAVGWTNMVFDSTSIRHSVVILPDAVYSTIGLSYAYRHLYVMNSSGQLSIQYAYIIDDSNISNTSINVQKHLYPNRTAGPVIINLYGVTITGMDNYMS